MKENLIRQAYEIAKERYAAIGVDVDKAMDTLQKISLSLHCWQADDVAGFESNGSLSGGIQATGNYPGKARNIDEVRQDVLKAASYLPGTHRLNLHEIYGNILPLPALDIVNEKQNYWDFSTGFMIYVPWERHYREFMHNFIGFSVNHFTRPKDNFIEENARIPIKLSLQWNSFIRTSLYSLDKKSSLYVCPGLLYENRGDRLLSSSSFDNFIVGSDIPTDPLFGGVWYSSQLLNSDKENYKAIIFKLGLKLNSANKKFEYRLAYSYDMSLGNLVKSTEGSHEISFNITYRFNAKYRYNIFSF